MGLNKMSWIPSRETCLQKCKNQVFSRRGRCISSWRYFQTYCRMGNIKEESSNTYVSVHGNTAGKSRSTITRHQEDKLSKATSSLFPIKMIAILEWTYSNVQQNIVQLQTPSMGVTINKKSATTEPPPKK